jgi:AcrR family transcriptional regulator
MDLRLPTDLSRRDEPTSAKRAQVERDVVCAADDLLRSGHRWNDLSVERLATAAGISRTAFYFYFRDKREVLMCLIAEVYDEVRDASIWLSSDADARELVHDTLLRVRDVFGAHGSLLQAIVELAAVDEAVDEFFRELSDGFADRAAERAESLRERGLANPILPTREATGALMAMSEKTFYEWQARGVEVTDDHVRVLSEVWIRTIYGDA